MKHAWVVVGLILLVIVSCVSYSFGQSSKVKMVDMYYTFGIYDGKMRPLVGEGGVVVVIKQVSFKDELWPDEHWSRVSGVPSPSGDLKGRAKFPLDPKVTADMNRAANQ